VRKQLERDARACGGEYQGDLTDKTTHLVATDISRTSQKLQVAREVGLPIVTPSWLRASASSGTLLPLTREYLLFDPHPPASERLSDVKLMRGSDESDRGQAARFMRAPLGVLQRAVARGELKDATILEAGSVWLDGRCYELSASTDLERGGARHARVACYSLLELLFGLRCMHLPHAEYFLECLRHTPYVHPVLLSDKKLLAEVVLNATGTACDASVGCASERAAHQAVLHQLELGPLSPTTLDVLSPTMLGASLAASGIAKREPMYAGSSRQLSQRHPRL